MKLESMFYISENNWYILQAWAKLAYDEDKNEISGLLTAVPQKDGRFELANVEILKQENTGTNTELDKDAVAQYTMKYGMKYNNPEMKFVWWHSHHTMGAFWSGTDEKEINAWQNSSFSLALVVNLREEYKFRVSIWKAGTLPVEEHYDTSLTIEREQPKIVITKAMKKQYDELCDKPSVDVTNLAYNYHRHNRYGYNAMQNTHQMTLLGERNLDLEASYIQASREAESLQDRFCNGTIKLTELRKEIKGFNKICKQNKLPFKFMYLKGNAEEVLNILITTMPDELFEWDNIDLKEKIETMAWNNSFGELSV